MTVEDGVKQQKGSDEAEDAVPGQQEDEPEQCFLVGSHHSDLLYDLPPP